MLRHYDSANNLDYVAPGAVRYDREDIEFLLPWLPYLREGRGPAEPEGGYIGANRSGARSRAPHEAWCQVAAEMDDRLARTGLDRELVEKAWCYNFTPELLARWYKLDAAIINRRIDSALSFISSGACRRWVECADCSRFPRCRKKKKLEHKTCTYADWKGHKKRRSK